MRRALRSSLGFRLTRTIGEEVFNRCAGLTRYQPSAKRLSPRNRLIDRPQDDRITGVLDDKLAAMKKAVFLSEFDRQADAAVCHHSCFHGATPIDAI
jgi:hypothetical protein